MLAACYGATSIRVLILGCLPLLAGCINATASDLYTTINQLRAGEGNCAVAQTLSPLNPAAALRRVAGNLSRGGNLQQSLTEAGYRATRSSALSIRSNGVGTLEPRLLEQQTYCRQLQDGAMTEVGIYQDTHQIWIVMATPFAPSMGMSEEAAGMRVLDLVNQARAKPRYCGNVIFKAARPVRWNDLLADASRLHAEEMARYNYFSHSGHDGSVPAQRVERAGYKYRITGENIAAGQMKPEDAVAGWIKSPPHCANLMNPAFIEMGAAFAVDRGSDMGVYWTQAFGAPH